MKKTLLSLITCLLVTSSAVYAQVEFGVKAGLDFPSIKMDGINNLGKNANDIGLGGSGYHFGLYATIDLGYFLIQPEVHYSIQTLKFKLNSNDGHKLNMTYIQIPILGRLNFLEVANIHAGPQFGIVLSNEIEYAGGAKVDIKDQTKSLNLGFAIGTGVDIPMIGAGLTARYVFGFSEMISGNLANSSPSSLKSSMFQLSATYAFGNN